MTRGPQADPDTARLKDRLHARTAAGVWLAYREDQAREEGRFAFEGKDREDTRSDAAKQREAMVSAVAGWAGDRDGTDRIQAWADSKVTGEPVQGPESEQLVPSTDNPYERAADTMLEAVRDGDTNDMELFRGIGVDASHTYQDEQGRTVVQMGGPEDVAAMYPDGKEVTFSLGSFSSN